MENSCHPNGAAVTFENVTVSLGGNTILESISAEIPRGSCTAVVGPNGAGKTTMLLALLGEMPFQGFPEAGRQVAHPVKVPHPFLPQPFLQLAAPEWFFSH